MKSILLVEDDLVLGAGLKRQLSDCYQVRWVKTLAEAQIEIRKEMPALVILDLNLPDGSGFTLLTDFYPAMKFILLTAQGDPVTRLKAYEFGADEFIAKPFHFRELQLRLEHVFDEHGAPASVRAGEFEIHFDEQSIKGPGGVLEYPPVNEMKILQLLVEHSPKPVSRDQIIHQVWGPKAEVSPRTIDNLLVKIRDRLFDREERFVRSVRGIGYQWVGTPEERNK